MVVADLYETLGVAKDASPEAIKAAHRRAVKATHPDVGGAPADFERVQLAYGILSDQRRRARYDETGHDAPPEPEALLRAQARTIVFAKLAEVVRSPQTDPRTYDLVLGIRELIDADRQSHLAQVQGIRAAQERLRQFARRLKRKASAAGPDPIMPMLENDIAAGGAQIAQLESHLQALAAARELAAEYIYRTDPHPMVDIGQTIGGGSGGGWFRTTF